RRLASHRAVGESRGTPRRLALRTILAQPVILRRNDEGSIQLLVVCPKLRILRKLRMTGIYTSHGGRSKGLPLCVYVASCPFVFVGACRGRLRQPCARGSADADDRAGCSPETRGIAGRLPSAVALAAGRRQSPLDR